MLHLNVMIVTMLLVLIVMMILLQFVFLMTILELYPVVNSMTMLINNMDKILKQDGLNMNG